MLPARERLAPEQGNVRTVPRDGECPVAQPGQQAMAQPHAGAAPRSGVRGGGSGPPAGLVLGRIDACALALGADFEFKHIWGVQSHFFLSLFAAASPFAIKVRRASERDGLSGSVLRQ
jgi:hypothetical protein